MLTSIIIAISFSLGFFVESIIGFGGGLLAYSILAFFLDVKSMVLSGLYVGTCSSAYIFYSDYKSFDKKIFKSIIITSLIGTILGVIIFTKFPAKILTELFGILLLFLAIKIIFFDKYIFPRIFKEKLIFIGGISQGAFGIGGPFWVNALQKNFQNKSALRTTMAACFVSFNIIRVAQLSIQGQLHLDFFLKILWIIIPVAIAINLGHKIHMKINEDYFKKGIAIMTLFAAVKFILK